MKSLLICLLMSVAAQATTITSWEPTPHAAEVSLNTTLDQRFGVGGWFQLPDPGVFPEKLNLVEIVANYAAATQDFQWTPVVGGWSACNAATNHPHVGTVCSDVSLNPDGLVHVLAFGIAIAPQQKVLAWEDWLSTTPPSDSDFNDLVALVEGPAPVPEPATWMLMGAGLLALGFMRRKRC